MVSIWVGIGGFFPSTLNVFSQAGVDIDVHFDQTVSFLAWYQYWSDASSETHPHTVEAPSSFTSTIRLGDEIRVTVWFTGSGLNANNYWKIEDLSQGTVWAPVPFTYHPPDSRTGEWILEDPGCNWLGHLITQCWVMPTMTKTVFAALSNNVYSGLAAPTLRLGEHDQFPDGCGYPFDQYLHPDYVYGTQSFSVPEQETTWNVCNTYGP